MTITLPDEMREELERNSRAEGFASVDEYVKSMLLVNELPIGLPVPSSKERYSVDTREALEEKLIEGLNRDGDVVEDSEFWDRRRLAAEDRASGHSAQ